MPIRKLSPFVVNQIAAGEVIERPASVAKELIENAIDAGASRIAISAEHGGRERITVTDDGGGIPFHDLDLALAPHATSKIESAEDLAHIGSMGFRGEALASIASVSRLRLLSRTAEQDEAGVIEAEGKERRPPRPASGPAGTTVTVRNLFFNTPARRKFLKRDQTETGRLIELVETLALAHPSVGFNLVIDEKPRLAVPPDQSPFERTLAVLGDKLSGELLEVERNDDGVRVWALIGTPDLARGNARNLRLFLNGRPIVDKSLHHAIREAYRGLIAPGRHPTAIVHLAVDPDTVDVNVHPAKAEVRFRDTQRVYRAVSEAIKSRLQESDLTPTLAVPAVDRRAVPAGPPPTFGRGGGRPMPHAPSASSNLRYQEMKAALDAAALRSADRSAAPSSGPPASSVLDLDHRYLVTVEDDALLVIDQHALHERVMFEKLKDRMLSGHLESQRLLMPATFTADRRDMEILDGLKPLLSRLGIEAGAMGPRSIGVHAFTGLLFERDVDPIEFMQTLLARAAGDGLDRDPEAALHEVLDMMACKAAIKSGDRLSQEEIEDLLRYRHNVERSSNCPHGRPTTLRLTAKDLDRQFGR